MHFFAETIPALTILYAAPAPARDVAAEEEVDTLPAALLVYVLQEWSCLFAFILLMKGCKLARGKYKFKSGQAIRLCNYDTWSCVEFWILNALYKMKIMMVNS